MTRFPLLLVLVLAPIALAGCASEDGAAPPSTADTVGTARAADTLATRPARRQIAVSIEGTTDTLSFLRYDTPEGYPLPFSIYVPEDMEVMAARPGEQHGAAIRIVAAFGGVANEDALLSIYAFDASVTESTAHELARDLARTRGGAELDAPRRDWAVAEYRLEGDAAGYVALGRHAGRWFTVLLRYPPEYGDGMAARAAAILETLRWQDTGTPLAP